MDVVAERWVEKGGGHHRAAGGARDPGEGDQGGPADPYP